MWLARAGEQREVPLRAERGIDVADLAAVLGQRRGHAGWLVRCLQEFAERDINLTKIESRPRREELGNYVFFADLAAPVGERRVQEALGGLREICEGVRVMGSYPAAEAPVGALAPAQGPR